MLQIRSVVYISICFVLVQDSIHKIQVQGVSLDDLVPVESLQEDDETTPYNAEQNEPTTEPAPEPTQEAYHDPIEEALADDTQGGPTTSNAAQSGASGAGLPGQRSMHRSNYTIKDEKKLTPDLVEKFTMPLLENRWKWDHRREALVKNFWFMSFNEKGKRLYRTLPTTTLAPLTEDEEEKLLKPLLRVGWSKTRPTITLRREFEFESFRVAFSFMSQVALLSERLGHFPDWYNFDNCVKITLKTSSIKDLSRKDIALAQFSSRVYDRMMGRESSIPERYK